MRRIVLFLLCCLLMVPFIAAAQSDLPAIILKTTHTPDRSAVIGAEILVITSLGITERYPVPASFYEAGDVVATSVTISPDLQRAVVFNMFNNPDSNNRIPPEAAIFNPKTLECCVYIQPPINNLDNIWFGDFGAGGTQLALSYVGITDLQTYTFGGAMGIVDLATGQFVSSVSIEEIRRATGEEFGAIALIDSWRQDGNVYFVPSCYACDGVPSMNLFMWNPATNSITQSDEFFTPMGDKLPLTGELLFARQNPVYPVSNENMGMFPPANVVEYYPEGRPPFGPEYDQVSAGVPVVYHDPNYLDLPFAYWVADGQAFVLPGSSSNNRQTILVNRDGSSMTVNTPLDYYVVSGMVDGWLMSSYGDGASLRLYHLVNGQVTETVLDQGSSYQAILEPDLGISVQGPFVTVQPNVIVPAPVASCPGFMQSRLVAGAQGRVTPGAANRLRAQPALTAQQIGEIPGGATFNVISGPNCDPAGIAWWEVNYNGIIGWTAEGQGNQYFTEPAF